VVNRGGDADTTGAMPGCWLGGCMEKQIIPEAWLLSLNKEITTHANHRHGR